jgi:hypothetical protein
MAARRRRRAGQTVRAPEEDGGRDADYFLFVKGNQPGVQRAVFDLIQPAGRKAPDHVELDYGHGRVIKRSLWVTDAGGLDFPQATRVARIRRDRYDITGSLISKDIVHAVTSLDAGQARAADLANTGYAGNGPQVMATFRNIAVSLLHHAGVTEITRMLQAIARDRTGMLSYLPL